MKNSVPIIVEETNKTNKKQIENFYPPFTSNQRSNEDQTSEKGEEKDDSEDFNNVIEL